MGQGVAISRNLILGRVSDVEVRRRITIYALVVTLLGGVKVKLVALEANKGFVLLQEVVGYGAVGSVTY
jgi:hypothetical protein